MAGIGHMGEVTGASMDTRGTATTPNVVVQVTGADEQERTAELYAPPGVASAPTPGDGALSVPVGQGGRIVIAVHNYKIEVPVEPGELVVYSTDETGEAVKASARFGADGSITVDADEGSGTITVNAGTVSVNADMVELAGSGNSLVTYAALNSALQDLVAALGAHVHNSAKPGDPTTTPTAPLMLDISASEATKVKTE